MNKIPDPSQEEEESRTLLLHWSSTNALGTQYANHLMITYTGTEFYLTFGEVVPPVIIGELEPDDLADSVEIKPIVRLAVSPAAMLKMTEIIDKNVGNFVKRFSTFGDAI